MAYSVNWTTKIVHIPKADLVVISASPEVYELNALTFWQQIHAIQQDEGLPFMDIMRSNAPVTLGGVTYARSVEVINNYKIEFEDGAYQVNLSGANNNLLDARVQNNVSLSASNSAGLVVGGGSGGLSPTQAAQIAEIHRRLGLDAAAPLTTTPTSILAGDIEMVITGDGETTSTVTRQ